jgi:HTH-type transcriptional regulator / antitoxin HigA
MALAKVNSGTVSVHPLHTDADYENVVQEIEKLWDAVSGTPEGDRLDVLMDLVEVYENRHHQIDLPDPIEAIKTRMSDLGLTRADIGELLGLRSGRISELLNRKNNRRLTLPMIRKLATALGLSFGCLCQPYEVSE